jgi:hypothetical protein
VVMNCEQYRQLVAVNRAAQVSGIPALIGHIGIVGGGMGQCSGMTPDQAQSAVCRVIPETSP